MIGLESKWNLLLKGFDADNNEMLNKEEFKGFM